MIRRILQFFTGQTKPSVIVASKLEKPAEIPAADIEQKVLEARARLAARQAQKATTTQAPATARTVPSSVKESTALTVRVLRVKPRMGGEYHVLAADLATAKASRAATVNLCDAAGVPIPTTDPTRRSSLPLAIVLSGMIEPVIDSIQRGATVDHSIPADTYPPADTLSQEQQESQGESEDGPSHNAML